jgi:hypothetical protein
MKTMLKRFFLFLLLCSSFVCHAQTKKKSEQEFLKQLNSILKNSKQQHWAYEGNAMSIDSAFAINKEGILSVTVRYTSNTSFVRVRMTAPSVKLMR